MDRTGAAVASWATLIEFIELKDAIMAPRKTKKGKSPAKAKAKEEESKQKDTIREAREEEATENGVHDKETKDNVDDQKKEVGRSKGGC